MSESSKMGLFGSKDDNTQETEANKDAVDPNDAPQDRDTPYNIDSDSETYDTESLSIMDINDIIGIQAESAGDSTLESEFAALSEVITDMKSDEEASPIGEVAVSKKIGQDRAEKSREGDSGKDEKLGKGSSKEDNGNSSRADENKKIDCASLPGINKSLLLIGEAYISDESQDTDNEESLRSAASQSKKEGAEDAEKIASTGKVANESSVKFEKIVAADKLVETAIEPTGSDAKNVEPEKFVDSTDSSAIDVAAKQGEQENKTESMDVDVEVAQPVAESVLIGESLRNEPKETKVLGTIVEEPIAESADVGTEKLSVASVDEAEELMEIDEPNEAISDEVETEKTKTVVAEDVSEGKSECSASIVTGNDETVDETEKSPKSIAGVESTKDDAETCTNVKASETSSDNQVSKPETSDLRTEAAEFSKTAEKEFDRSEDGEIDAETVEMETDETRRKDSFADGSETNSPAVKIVESITEEADTTTNDDETKISPEETRFDEETTSERLERATERHFEITLVERAETPESEAMQIDDNAEYHRTVSDKKVVNSPRFTVNYVDIDEPVADSAELLKNISSDEAVVTASNSGSNSSKNIETSKIPNVPDMVAGINVDNETFVSSSVSETLADVVEPDSNIAPKECTEDEDPKALELGGMSEKNERVRVIESNEKSDDERVSSELEESLVSATIAEPMETEDVTLKDGSEDELPARATLSSESSSKIAETVPNIIASGCTVATTDETSSDDDRMEVDAAGKKEKRESEKDEILPLDEASRKPEKSASLIVEEVDSMIGTPKNADEMENPVEKNVEETVEIPEESATVESSENETAKSIDETDVAREESKNEENVAEVVIREAESSSEEFDEISAAEAAEIRTTGIVVEDKNAVTRSETKTEKDVVRSESSKSTSENRCVAEFAETVDDSMDERETKDAASLGPTKVGESTTEEVRGTEITEPPDSVLEENVPKAEENPLTESKEDGTELEVVVGIPETSTGAEETEVSEAPVATIEDNAGNDGDEAAATTDEEAKESLVSVDRLEQSIASGEIQTAESSDAMIRNVEDENEQTELKASTISRRDSTEMVRDARSIEIPDEAIVEDASEEKKELESESMEAETDPAISVEATVEISANSETEKSHEDAAKIPSTVTERQNDERSSFLAPETFPAETRRSDMLSSSINPDDVEGEEDPVEEEMNLSLDPDVNDCQQLDSQELDEKEAREIVEFTAEEISVDADEMEDQVEINLSLDPEEKDEDSPNVRDDRLEKLAVDDSVDESTMNFVPDRPEQTDERLEKPTEDNDDDDDDDDASGENSKNILSTIVCESEMFVDEQSQNTQEMMDSILETDSSNFNKILDDEEDATATLACANDLPLEETEIDELTDKLPSESEEMLNKALDDPMSSQNIDSLEGLLDLDLIQEGDEATLKSVDPIVAKVMNAADDDIETKDVDVSLLLAETDQGESMDRDEYASVDAEVAANSDVIGEAIEEEAMKLSERDENLLTKSAIIETVDSSVTGRLESPSSAIVDNDIAAAFDLTSVEPDSGEADRLTSERSKLELAEDLLREIAVDEERKMELAEELLLESTVDKDDKIVLPVDLLLQNVAEQRTKIDLAGDVLSNVGVDDERRMELVEEVLLEAPVEEVSTMMEPSDDITLERVVRDQVLTVAADIEHLQPNSEISELESAVKFLQESEENIIDSTLSLSPKMVDGVVDEITQVEDVGIFVTDGDICEDPTALVAELENIIPDPIAISEAEIISEAAKLESEKKSKLSEEAKLRSPVPTKTVELKKGAETEPISASHEIPIGTRPHPETPKTHRAPRSTTTKTPEPVKIEETVALKKSAPIPHMSILEERLKVPPKIEIPSVGEVSRISETPSTPKTSLLIQRDAKLTGFPKMLESPKASEKGELKIIDTPRKDSDKHDFENVGSPRIILKIAKSAIADCGEPRSPKSPKIRSATNSPNPEDSPGQKLGKIKLKLSKSGHPSIISNENVEEICGQWHTEGASSLSPLGMKIKFSKIGDASIVQTDKHDVADETKEPPKHKFEEAKRTESPIGMKIKFSRTGDASIVQQDVKDSTSKHKDKSETAQSSPKRNESPIGMKIKFSKSGDASIIQPEKSDSSDDHRESASRVKDKSEGSQEAARRTESPLGMKFKLFKTGDASIVGTETGDDSPQEPKRTDSPLGMKIKLSKVRGSASIIPVDSSDDVKDRLEVPELPRRTESPLGMKIKFSKTGDASIIHSEDPKDVAPKHKERTETIHDSATMSEISSGVKTKPTKSRDAATVQTDVSDDAENVTVSQKRMESSIGMKFKLSKTGDASIVHSETQGHVELSRTKEKIENSQETGRKPDGAIGMKIKFSKTGDASIVQPQSIKRSDEPTETENEHQRSGESPLGMKIKLQRNVDVGIGESEKKEKSLRRKDMDSPLEMKIKLSKTGHPTIVACDSYGETSQRMRDAGESNKVRESTSPKEMPGMKMLKSVHSGMHGNRAELTIEPVQLTGRNSDEPSPKRKDLTISPVESKKAKLETKLSHMLPEVTIQPIIQREQKPIVFDAKANSISRQQMNVISQEISITQVRSNKAMDLSMTDKLKSMLAKNATTSGTADCEIIEHRPELIIVNENSNSSQDVMIIEELPALRGPEAKVPKKRGRPRRNPLPIIVTQPIMPIDSTIPRDPLALDSPPQLIPQMSALAGTQMVMQTLPPKENERPKRTCSRQKSYAPPRRGRRRGGGGRGKRKLDMDHMELSKKPRIDQDLDLIEQSTTGLITIDETPKEPVLPEISHHAPELYKALRQPPMDHKMANAIARVEAEQAVNEADLLAKTSRECLMDSRLMSHLDGVIESVMKKPTVSENFATERKMSLDSVCSSEDRTSVHVVTEQRDKIESMIVDGKTIDKTADETKENKDAVGTQDHQNWLTPSSKRLLDGRNDGNISNVQVIDEETRMSAESSSRSQTPARNMSLQAPETIVNEESQGSVLSTATTESEKVKVKNRRMEISFDPDEGPFTVDKIAEYEWPLDPGRKGETFMIQEQISQYLGVKSFKRKYPDLKRRMVDMEERNYLRENGLVSEAMCDMGLTAVSSSEVLDVMCNDFPDQYEEYRKYIRERQMKEHFKKQKELTAAANAEKNRIDLAEMAVQSALSWNVGLNKARRESRKCSLDLQTFTIHVPKKQQKVEEESRQSHYPVALIPGQYTDYYREYTPAELRYYPLNTVLYGPMKPNERKLDSQSEGSQSDSDTDSSSDDSSSSSSDGTQDTEESQSTMDEVDVELSRQKEDIKSIKCKMCLKHLNKLGRSEVLIQCGTCNGYVHPSCIDLTLDMVPHIQAYAWQCTDCKTCAQCHDPADEDKMLFCDMCDRGYHIYCVGLRRVPQGRWHCQECAVCASCGSREAGGANSDRNSVAQWQHEYKKGDKNTRVYVSTLCVPCSKLCGDQGPDNRSEKLSV